MSVARTIIEDSVSRLANLDLEEAPTPFNIRQIPDNLRDKSFLVRLEPMTEDAQGPVVCGVVGVERDLTIQVFHRGRSSKTASTIRDFYLDALDVEERLAKSFLLTAPSGAKVAFIQSIRTEPSESTSNQKWLITTLSLRLKYEVNL